MNRRSQCLGHKPDRATLVQSYAQLRDGDQTPSQKPEMFANLVAESNEALQMSTKVRGKFSLPNDWDWEILGFTWLKLRKCRFPIRTNENISGYVYVAILHNTITLLRRKRNQLPLVQRQREDENYILDNLKTRTSVYDTGLTFRASCGNLVTVSIEEFQYAIRELESHNLDDSVCIRFQHDDVSMREMADVMGKSLNQIRHLCSRSRRRLKAILERQNRD